MTTFVAEDGQGGHIIISGAAEYQDGSVVQMAGQQVSRVAEGQLITIASGESAPVSIAGTIFVPSNRSGAILKISQKVRNRKNAILTPHIPPM